MCELYSEGNDNDDEGSEGPGRGQGGPGRGQGGPGRGQGGPGRGNQGGGRQGSGGPGRGGPGRGSGYGNNEGYGNDEGYGNENDDFDDEDYPWGDDKDDEYGDGGYGGDSDDGKYGPGGYGDDDDYEGGYGGDRGYGNDLCKDGKIMLVKDSFRGKSGYLDLKDKLECVKYPAKGMFVGLLKNADGKVVQMHQYPVIFPLHQKVMKEINGRKLAVHVQEPQNRGHPGENMGGIKGTVMF